MCLAPASARSSDLIVIVLGLNIPLVINPLEEDLNEIIGEFIWMARYSTKFHIKAVSQTSCSLHVRSCNSISRAL